MPATVPSQQPKLLDEVRSVLRLHHYSIHTERSYVEWIVRFIRFHHMHSRADLFPAEAKIEAFLTNLAVHGDVAHEEGTRKYEQRKSIALEPSGALVMGYVVQEGNEVSDGDRRDL